MRSMLSDLPVRVKKNASNKDASTKDLEPRSDAIRTEWPLDSRHGVREHHFDQRAIGAEAAERLRRERTDIQRGSCRACHAGAQLAAAVFGPCLFQNLHRRCEEDASHHSCHG